MHLKLCKFLKQTYLYRNNNMENVIFHLPVLCQLIQYFLMVRGPLFLFLFVSDIWNFIPLSLSTATSSGNCCCCCAPPVNIYRRLDENTALGFCINENHYISKMDNWSLYWLDWRAF
jgi:hypothetical protein